MQIGEKFVENMKTPETAEEYMQMARWFTALVDAELSRAENTEELHLVAERLPRLVSLVNAVGHMRDGFLDFRPREVLVYQPQLYAAEDALEARLYALIEKVYTDEREREQYIWHMHNQYVTFRTPIEYRDK